jgi:hypothetical protein
VKLPYGTHPIGPYHPYNTHHSNLQPVVSEEPIGCTDFAPFGIMGKNLEVKGVQTIQFLMESVTFSHTFVVCKLPTNITSILGINMLLPRRAKLNLET